MTEERKYIYSIINKPKEMWAPDTSRLPGGLFGINNRDITFVSYRDISATVSNTHHINFNKFDKKELTQLIVAHDQVNVGLMKKYDIIPMRFGMIAESAEEIRNILAKAYIQFRAALERIAGKAEFIVQVFWNEKNILEKLVQENIEIRKLKKEVESRGKILGFSSKIKLGKRIFEALESCRKEYTEDILSNLAISFPNFSAGPLRRSSPPEARLAKGGSEASKLLDASKEGSANEINKEMIMNYSFLIGMTEESALSFRLNQLAEKYKEEIKFKYIGPMAPYSFAVINLSLGNFDLVDSARRAFGLGELVTFPEIKKTYYKLAGQHHPDKQAFTKDKVVLEEAEKKIKDIITANEILTIYCKYYLSALAPEKEQLCSFRKEDVEDSVIIKEKQSDL